MTLPDSVPTLLFDLLAVAVLGVCSVRWIRVAQREHYLAGRVTRVALLWARSVPVNAGLWLAALAGVVAGTATHWGVAAAAAAILTAWPLGLPVRSRPAPLRFTRRAIRLMIGYLVPAVLVTVLLGGVAGVWFALLGAPLCDLLLLATAPIEARISQRYVKAAKAKLDRIRPLVIGITGSYGKTSTKQYVRHLLAATRVTVASPGSFNNLMGLSRTVNEYLHPGAEVLVAEMGTYGPGEIRTLCQAFPPSIAAITTIGEAHLERMGSREAIFTAKREIIETAQVVVLNVDVPELAGLADHLAGSKQVIRCSAAAGEGVDAAVSVTDGTARAFLAGELIAEFELPETAHAGNVAIALGVASAAGTPVKVITRALANLPSIDHRATERQTEAGIHVIDDTYNSNPQGAQRALAAAAALAGADHRVWVVTPGMVELGQLQEVRNAEFGRAVAAIERSTLAIVGRINQAALHSGAKAGGGAVLRYPTRELASHDIMGKAEKGDVILYENDLPDHYP